ncbi:hypothetical protein AVEN_68589-1, partial [Araneus ventricosus]
SSAGPSPRVPSPAENNEPAQDFQRGSPSPDAVSDTIAGYNGMVFTTWVTLPGEKLQTYIVHSTQGPRHDEAA